MAVYVPETTEILDLLNMILGDNSPLQEVEKAWELDTVPQGTHVTYLCDGDGDKLGAVVTDINGTVYLGGKLIMMHEAGLAGKAASGVVEENLVEAVEEIVNMLRSVFNNQPGSEHVSPLPTRLLETPDADGDDAWLLDPSERLDLQGKCSFGTLRMSFLFR